MPDLVTDALILTEPLKIHRREYGWWDIAGQSATSNWNNLSSMARSAWRESGAVDFSRYVFGTKRSEQLRNEIPNEETFNELKRGAPIKYVPRMTYDELDNLMKMNYATPAIDELRRQG